MKLIILDFETGDVLVLPYSVEFGDVEDYIIELIDEGKLCVSLNNIQYMTTNKEITVIS